ncbi:MAG: hypothetical protein G3M70_03175 [Candidatus Nitronauta litoralis]|uniref:Uncharacterized protein n=1 Tax=Candidatus Nitronauta litoralis TaxID=2705533 RepID=A0A7T0BU01_9BACT|nr:MAG: hypothetical protein G3M70_03175 [Candidatus Nitronauta litoralis]
MKRIIGLMTALAFVGFTGVASANETTLAPGETSECVKAGWIAYNTSETKDTTLEFNIGPYAYNWGKVQKVELAPSGFESNAIAQKTTFKNNGPGNVIVNCQRQRFDRHDWKIDAGSGKTYQNEYHLDHVQPDTYVEPGLGLPVGTERGIFGTQGQKSEVGR